MILVTGGAGFIGSVLVWRLNELGRDDIAVVDHFGSGPKWQNLAKRQIRQLIVKDELPSWLLENRRDIQAVFHMGACSSTAETNVDYLTKNNFQYSVNLFEYCTREKLPFIYASSAATYGNGEKGYIDTPGLQMDLRPVTAYGFSKNAFDQWVHGQVKAPPFWAGLKFFNVFGPQEYHKGTQASMVFHAYNQITSHSSLKLFKSYRDGVSHGEQQRDFVYVKDAVDFMIHLFTERRNISSGLFNVGTGIARSFADLGKAVFDALDTKVDIKWIEMPEEMRSRYQYYTAASLDRVRNVAGYHRKFHTLEEGVNDYVKGYLSKADAYL